MSSLGKDEIADLRIKLQAIIFSIEDGIVMVDFEGEILVMNDRARKMLCIQKGYPYDKKFLDYLQDADVRVQFKTLLDHPDKVRREEIIVPGEPRSATYRATKNVVTTARGEEIGRVLALHDITMEKEIERLKDDFVHSITHDLKGPLTSVQGFLGLFLEGELGPVTAEQSRSLNIMVHSTGKLLRMINNILDMAKLDAGRMLIQKTEWNVLQTIDELFMGYGEIAKHHKIRLFKTVQFTEPGGRTYKVDEAAHSDHPVTVLADGSLLERVITNLFDNAMKFTPANGQIEILVESLPDRVQVSVKDSGRGIPAEALGKIFQKFQQAPGTKGGTGLGLTIAKHIVEEHGGQIGVESEKGKGSNFHFWIPKISTGKEAVRA